MAQKRCENCGATEDLIASGNYDSDEPTAASYQCMYADECAERAIDRADNPDALFAIYSDGENYGEDVRAAARAQFLKMSEAITGRRAR